MEVEENYIMRSFIVCTLNYILIIDILTRLQHQMRFSRKSDVLYRISYYSFPCFLPYSFRVLHVLELCAEAHI
jgi:hypothetical protein